jgi:hypothetical protein
MLANKPRKNNSLRIHPLTAHLSISKQSAYPQALWNQMLTELPKTLSQAESNA